MTKPMKVKAFLIACILLATVVFSPLPTCTARELGGPGGYKPLPNKPPFNCGRGNRYCVRPAPKQREVWTTVMAVKSLQNGISLSTVCVRKINKLKFSMDGSDQYVFKMKAFLIAFILLATVVFSPLSTCTARELVERGRLDALAPGKAPFNCGKGNRYCVTPRPKKRCSPYIRNCGKPKVEKQIQNFVGFSFCLPLLVILSGVTKPSLTSKAFFLFVSCLVPEKFQGN
uniref:Uncharacterized protein n=2 Tax=Salix viminalis TaxID=40686 RepID=A0A6N2LQ63_SALVM